MTGPRLPVCVAAGSTAAAVVGAETLRAGGSAADAAVAMALTACAAETVFTGLAGGGFAIHYEAATGTTRCLDFFVAVPGLTSVSPTAGSGPSMTEPGATPPGQPGRHVTRQPEQVLIDFGGEIVPYAVGPATVAVPGVPAGLGALHDRWGVLDWADVVEPALRTADRGVRFGSQQAAVLTTVADAMLVGGGRAAYAPDDILLDAEATLHHPGLADAFRVLRDEGPAAFYTGRIGAATLTTVGDAGLTETDLASYRPMESAPREVTLGRFTLQARGTDLDDLLGVMTSLDLEGDDISAARALVGALRAHPRRGDTSSAAATDAAGNACAVTTSLGLSSGVWLPGYGIHLNSMLGEGELLRGELVPGERMGSMMTPLVMLDKDGLFLVGGAAGGSRIRSALAQVLLRVVRESLPVAEAIRAPRLNPVPGRVHVEPGFPEHVVEALAETDLVSRWPAQAAYFGGVAAIDRHGPGADPRRDGDTRWAALGVS